VLHWQRILESAIANPSRRLGSLQLLGKQERAELVRGRNRGPRVEERWTSAVKRFQQVAAAHPERIAIGEKQHLVSYGALRDRAETIRRAIEARRIGREDRVAVYLERSSDLIAAFLGIQACQAVYVPLDPGYPVERLSYMAENSGARLLLSQRSMQEKLPEGFQDLLWVEDLDRGGAAAGEWKNPVPRQLAYVLYTSGSTGRPKGVMVEHGGMWNHLQAKVEELGLGAEDRV